MEYNMNQYHQECTAFFPRERNTKIQRTLQVHFMCIGRLLTNKPVGQFHPKNRDASKHTTEVKRNAKRTNTCASQHTTQFKLHDSGTIGVCRPNPQKS